jgi:integrase
VFFDYKSKHLDRPDAIAHILKVALRFWGAPDKTPPSDDAPCHDLRLCDPILDPDWLLKWEAWLTRRGLGAQSKNHYRGLMRRMYAVAMLPEFRKRTGVQMNPFAGIPNDPTYGRDVTVEPARLRAWITHASFHIRLAVAIGALAPKLRLRNVLALRWSEHFDPDPRTTKFSPARDHFIVIKQHKTARRTRKPLVVPISRPLLQILRDAWRRHPSEDLVVVYRTGQQLHDITGGVKAAAKAAKIPYGRGREDGATFHTLRHIAATLMSEDEADPLKLKDAMGHGDIRTTLKYRHRKPAKQRPTFERLAGRLKLVSAVTKGATRARRK